MTTKRLLKDYIKLRDDIEKKGPTKTLIVVRRLLNQTMQLYRLEQRYEKAKTNYPVFIEFLESAEPLTERDLKNLKDATTVNREITHVLREWHRGGEGRVTE